MRAAVAAVCLAVCLAAVAPAAAQLPDTLAELLTNPTYKPFITKVMGIDSCMNDKKLAKFQIKQCPSLQRLLDAVQLGNTNPPVACEVSCVEQFAVLSPKCGGDLRDAFEGDNTDTGRLATEFFQKCEELMNPAPAPAPALATAVIAELVEAAPGPIANLTAPEPIEVLPLAPSAGVAHKAVMSLLALAAATALLLA